MEQLKVVLTLAPTLTSIEYRMKNPDGMTKEVGMIIVISNTSYNRWGVSIELRFGIRKGAFEHSSPSIVFEALSIQNRQQSILLKVPPHNTEHNEQMRHGIADGCVICVEPLTVLGHRSPAAGHSRSQHLETEEKALAAFIVILFSPD